MFNSHLFDFTEGWFYVFGVGAIGGFARREQSTTTLPQEAPGTAGAGADVPGVVARCSLTQFAVPTKSAYAWRWRPARTGGSRAIGG